jgi:NAD(P)-dependent dehydrogenase (short-subunit alcohol dehydrogenase family)
MDGRSTHLVVIQHLLLNYAASPRTATTNCGYWLWMSLIRPASMQQQLNLRDKPSTSCSTTRIIGPRGQTIGNIDYEAWAEVLAVNTMGPMRLSEAFIEQVASSDRKLIVTVTSGMGSIADNTSGGSIVYRSSKAAVNMVMRSLAIDLAPRGITCVVVNPGWVRTDMGGPNANLQPAESISALRRLIATLGPEQSGKFFNHTGREYPW